MKRRTVLISGFCLLLIELNVVAQNSHNAAGEELNNIKYTVPFLTIAPDSRAGAMGDAGAATSPDVNSMHWNPAKYAFVEHEMEIALSYTPLA